MEFTQIEINSHFYQLDDKDNFEIDDNFRQLWIDESEQLQFEGIEPWKAPKGFAHLNREKWGNTLWSDIKFVKQYAGHYPPRFDHELSGTSYGKDLDAQIKGGQDV